MDLAVLDRNPSARDDDPHALTELVERALSGNQHAWRVLFERFTPLIRAVVHRYGLSAGDAEDVGQLVWCKLVERLGEVRQPCALPGWIATTAKRESLQLLKYKARVEPADPNSDLRFDRIDPDEVEAELCSREEARAVRDGLSELRPEHRDLLALLGAQPPVPYQEISRRLGIPIGSIGPTRARCLTKLRATKGVRRIVERPDETCPRSPGGYAERGSAGRELTAVG